MRQAEAFLLGRYCWGYANLFMGNATLGQQDPRACAGRQGIRPPSHPAQGDDVGMEARTDNERLHEDRTLRIPRLRIFPSVFIT